nr:MAG TPA: hypothetical protein [Caudoviricetes sp.]
MITFEEICNNRLVVWHWGKELRRIGRREV